MNEPNFPNGFTSWYETFYEIVTELVKKDYDNHPSKLVRETYDICGSGGMYELAKELTDKFELQYFGVEWGSDEYLCYFDRLEEFLNKELYD